MPAFTYERVKEYTGKVQYRTDGSSFVRTGQRRIARGEVVRLAVHPDTAADPDVAEELLDTFRQLERVARGLVATGHFIHVPADTPTGIPQNEVAPPEQAPTSTPLTEEEF